MSQRSASGAQLGYTNKPCSPRRSCVTYNCQKGPRNRTITEQKRPIKFGIPVARTRIAQPCPLLSAQRQKF